jgi:ketosteroid isomerase-like protein
MKRLSLVLLLTLALASLAQAQEPTASPSTAPKPAMSKAQSQRIIIATERKLWDAWKAQDAKPFRANLSTDSVLIGDTGVADRETVLKLIAGGGCDVKSVSLSDIKVAFVASNTALITYKAAQEGTCGGEALPANVWASSVYVKRGNKWWAVSHQESTAK